jgi:hypothetical protein
MTRNTRIIASASVLTTSLIDARTNGVVSKGTTASMPGGNDGRRSSSARSTARAASPARWHPSPATRPCRGGLAIEAAHEFIGLGAEFDPRDIAELQHRAVGVAAQDDVAELLRRLQAFLRADGRVELLPFDGRGAAELADRHLRVLRLHGRDHVRGREPVGGELVRIQPDPHRVLRAEHLHRADARHAAQRIDDVCRSRSRKCRCGSCCRRSRRKPTIMRKPLRDLVTLSPWRCTACGSEGNASCSLFCTCTCAMSGFDSAVEGQRDGRTAARLAAREMYSRPSRPFMFCSMICVTESSTTLADAPG